MEVAGERHGSGAAAGITTFALFGLASLVGVGLVLPAAFVRIDEVAVTPIVLLAALVLGFLARERPVSNGVLLGLLGALFGLRLVWILAVDPPLVSDFAQYWKIANTWAESGVPYPLTDLYDRRAWPYLWPLAALFGKSHAAYQLANLAVLAFASLAMYRYAAWRFGRLNAQAALLFANLAPETFGAAGIASHDVAGLLFLSGLGLVVLWMDRLTALGGRIPLLALGSFLLAVLAKLVEIQRLPATLVIASLLLAAVASPLMQVRDRRISRGDWRLVAHRSFFLAVLPALFLAAGTPALDRVIGDPHGALAGKQRMSFLHDASEGSYAYKKEVVLEHMADVPSAEKQRLARSLALSGWADDPHRRIWNIGLRADRLFDFGSDLEFYAAGSSDVKAAARKTYRWLGRSYAVVLGGLLVLLPVGLISVARRSASSVNFPVTDWPVIFVACFSLALLTISEVQSRYLLPIYFLATPWCLAVVSRQLRALVEGGRGDWQPARRLGSDALFAAGAVLTVYALWLGGGMVLDARYGHADGRIVNLLSGSTQPSKNLAWGETGSNSKEEHDHADSFGPYDVWIAYGTPQPREPAHLHSRVCGLDPERSWQALLYLERTDLREEPAPSESRCRIGAGDRWLSCDVPAEHRLQPITVPGLRADASGCAELFLRLEPIEGAKATEELWRVALLRLAPE